MQKPLSKAEFTKLKNLENFMKQADNNKFSKISKESFLKELKANKNITEKTFTDPEINNIIKKFKNS